MTDEQFREDELISAYLDNEATPAEIAEIEADDALLARVEQLRAVRDAVSAPVPPISEVRRDQMIDAALGVADAEAQDRLEAKVVPLHRPQRLLLAMAAAVVLLAAVAGAGLIASRGGDDAEQMATEAVTMADTAAPADMAEEEPAAEMDMAAAAPEMAEEPMAEEAPMPEEESMAEPTADAMAMAEAGEPTDEALAAETAMEAAAAAEAAPAATTTGATATTIAAPEAGDSDDTPPEQVVNLGTMESLESLFKNIGASWSAALEDGALAGAGACSSAVNEQALESSAETLRSFVATVGTDDPLTFDARFARRDDGTAVIIYAAPPDCEVGVHELPGS